MARPKVLDSWALLYYLEQKSGYEKIIHLFNRAAESSESLLMSVMNWGEVYYQVARRYGESQAQEIERLIQSFPVTVVDAGRELTREAARLKAVKDSPTLTVLLPPSPDQEMRNYTPVIRNSRSLKEKLRSSGFDLFFVNSTHLPAPVDLRDSRTNFKKLGGRS